MELFSHAERELIKRIRASYPLKFDIYHAENKDHLPVVGLIDQRGTASVPVNS
jgi:hypothetical protein